VVGQYALNETFLSKFIDSVLRAVFGGLPEPNRACLVGVYAFLI